ncbi:hypothetical protein N018_21945 [Pseudomonas syringae CC1557]|uniref:Uncharacterized protein n=1 Tax=Pseudomonas syringae CC1557 TaxID=1357279 RepID=W0N3M8_PSESX|nr:hypothetical protein N018_21945 [Pseudomonas syringae CC1557]
MIAITRAGVCDIAKKQSVRPNSKYEHGYHVALSVCISGWGKVRLCGYTNSLIDVASIDCALYRSEHCTLVVSNGRCSGLEQGWGR